MSHPSMGFAVHFATKKDDWSRSEPGVSDFFLACVMRSHSVNKSFCHRHICPYAGAIRMFAMFGTVYSDCF